MNQKLNCKHLYLTLKQYISKNPSLTSFLLDMNRILDQTQNVEEVITPNCYKRGVWNQNALLYGFIISFQENNINIKLVNNQSSLYKKMSYTITNSGTISKHITPVCNTYECSMIEKKENEIEKNIVIWRRENSSPSFEKIRIHGNIVTRKKEYTIGNQDQTEYYAYWLSPQEKLERLLGKQLLPYPCVPIDEATYKSIRNRKVKKKDLKDRFQLNNSPFLVE